MTFGHLRIVSLAFIAGCLAGSFTGCSRGRSGEEPAQRPLWQSAAGLSQVHAAHALDAERDSQLNSRRILPFGFVGSQACAECHQDKAQAFFNTTHARSGRFVGDTAVTQGRDWDDKAHRRSLRVTVEDGRMVHAVQHFAPDGSITSYQYAQIAFEFGSGTHAHTYAFRDGVFWCESPLSWYAKEVGWELSPGFDKRTQPEFDREVSNRCVYCHVGAIEQWNHNPHHFEILQAAIGCERCHSGGKGHVQYHSIEASKRGDSVDPIVNPAALPRSAREAVCSQCHLQGDQLIVSDQSDVWDFVPGQAIESNRTEIRLRGEIGHRIVGHTEQLRESDCYVQSDHLTCVTCHDPHGEKGPEDSSHYRKACLECHSNESCHVEVELRIQTNENACATCHMPLQPTDVVHTALHHHRIGVHAESYPPGTSPTQSPTKTTRVEQAFRDKQPQSLYPLVRLDASSNQTTDGNMQDRRRSLAVYNAIFNGASGDTWESDLVWARKQLVEHLKRSPRDRAVRVALARDYLNHGQIEQAERLLGSIAESQTRLDRSGVQSIAMFAEIRMRQHNSVQAKPFYRRLTELRRVAGDHYLHGLCCINTGDQQAATRSFAQALRIDPRLAAAHAQLARIFDSKGKKELSESHQQAIRTTRSQN